MSIYGNFTSTVIDESVVLEDTYLGQVITEAKIPQELRMNVEDILNAGKFKQKTTAILKYMKENKFKDKIIQKTVYSWYYAILGNTFAPENEKFGYQPKMGYYLPLVKANCNEKQIIKIRSDIEKTLSSLDKLVANGKQLNNLQKAYYNDIKNNLGKI